MTRQLRDRDVPDIPVAPVLKELTGEDVYEAAPGETRWHKISCPFHEDRTPSASINYLGFTCFSCEIEGDAYKILMAVEGLDFVAAKRRAEEITGVEGRSPSRKRRRSSSLLGYSGTIS